MHLVTQELWWKTGNEITSVYIHAGTTSILQPMDQGVHDSFKNLFI